MTDLHTAQNRRDSRWKRGDTILWTYTNPDFPELVDQRPVTVVADDDRHLAVWLAPGSRMLHQVLADGSSIRSVEGTKRFTEPRAQAIRDWAGSGILAVFQPDTMYSVWFFETASGRRDSYYINIELPFVRTADGIETSDLVLDVVVEADRSYQYKDEDELEFAQQAGLFSPSDVVKIQQAAADAVDDVTAWGFPFNAGFENFQPDSEWPVPALPHDATWTFETWQPQLNSRESANPGQRPERAETTVERRDHGAYTVASTLHRCLGAESDELLSQPRSTCAC